MPVIKGTRNLNFVEKARQSTQGPNKDLVAVRSRMSIATVGNQPIHKGIKSKKRVAIGNWNNRLNTINVHDGGGGRFAG